MIVIDLMEEDAGYEVLSASPFRATNNPVAASFAQNKMHRWFLAWSSLIHTFYVLGNAFYVRCSTAAADYIHDENNSHAYHHCHVCHDYHVYHAYHDSHDYDDGDDEEEEEDEED